MANKKITQLPQLTAISGDEDVLVDVNSSNYRVKTALLAAGGSIVATKASIGLDQVDNTSDINKPVSVATLASLSGKAESTHVHTVDDVTDLANQLLAKADASSLAAKANATHPHTIADVTGLQAQLGDLLTTATATVALAGKADLGHTHLAADILDLTAKADVAHGHAIADIVDLTTTLASLATIASLNNKAEALHAHTVADVTGLATDLANKADSLHIHAIANVTGLSDALLAKADTTHAHASSELTDLAALLAQIAATRLPQISVAVSGVDASSAFITINYTTSNGYSMSTVSANYRYRVVGAPIWEAEALLSFNNGQLSYNSQAVSLTAASNYELEVYLSDTNNPSLAVSVTTLFTTL